jgi:glycosyltransferase involved in cell wall biosynthesis
VSQETSEAERKIAKQYGLRLVENSENLGIEGAWRCALDNINNNYCLVLENDCPLIETKDTTFEELKRAKNLLENGTAQVVRLRSRRVPGAKFYNVEKYSRYFEVEAKVSGWRTKLVKQLRRTLRPMKAKRLSGSSVYALSRPEYRHKQIRRVTNNTYLVPSSILNWTNQSVMINRKFMVDTLLARVKTHPSSRALNGFQDIERSLNSRWWRKSNFTIAVTSGLFSHMD